ncbi:MAG: dolichol-phosphate mannosyltransferase [Actinobacteria bacterium HGW-Actinobacteria-1]|nr:MAG: dolichol-phosphate mannosyltransferase [Actinobacteria bacterium HGW-Actinobacteria-1]
MSRRSVGGTLGGTTARTIRHIEVVLPAFNESRSIGDLIARVSTVLRDAGFDYSILVVDDGSADTTAEDARRAGEGLPVRVVSNERNLGLGRTIARGLRMASEQAAPGDVIVTLDADLTQDPVYIPSMAEAYLGGCDVVIASRFRPGSQVHGLSAFRKAMTAGARIGCTIALNVPGVRDYSCGFRLYDAPMLREMFARHGDDFVLQNGFACMVEILGKLRRRATICEVPFELHYEAKRSASTMHVWRTVGQYVDVVRDVHRFEAAERRTQR